MITSYFTPKKLQKKRKCTEIGPESSSSNTISHESSTPKTTSITSPSQETIKLKRKNINDPLKEDDLDPSVRQLLSHLTDDSWKNALAPYVSKSGKFRKLALFVRAQRESKTVYPPECDTFSALNLLPIDNVKVIIVGQDPYHQPGQGHGLAFSVRKGVKIPPSLRNIYKEILNNSCISQIPTHGCLEMWAKRGVLLLNACLTVRRGEANSHAGMGWEEFTNEIIRVLVERNEERKDGRGLVFLLWGKPASKKAEPILARGKMIGCSKNNGLYTVICTSHPSPLGATKTSSPFLGSRCFQRANEALVKMGREPINWSIDETLNQNHCTESKQNLTPLTKKDDVDSHETSFEVV